jgi:hypothetical protein
MEACDMRQRRVGKASEEAEGKSNPNLRTRENERGDRYRPDRLSVISVLCVCWILSTTCQWTSKLVHLCFT